MARAPKSPDGDKLPLSALKHRIDDILRDERMTANQRLATVAVALHGNKRTGLAYPGQRRLRREYHVGGRAIPEALACPKPGEDRKPGLAIGVHLEPAGRGPRGVQQYRVIPGERPGGDPDGPQGSSSGPSAPTGGALHPSSAPETAGSAPVSPSSAPGCAAQRAQGGRETVVEREKMNGEKERLLSLAFPKGATEKQRAALLKPVREAAAAGVPYPLMAHALVSPKTDGAPWKRIDEAKARARGIVEAVNDDSQKHFEDLAHLLNYAQNGGDGLPARIEVGGKRYGLSATVRQCTTWPDDRNRDEEAG